MATKPIDLGAQQLQAAQLDAVKVLSAMPLRERIAFMAAVENESLAVAEAEKGHAITAEKFTAQELAELKAHLLDGGGVLDDSTLLKTFVCALLDEDWPTVCREIPHVIKCYLKLKGVVVHPAEPGGAVVINGAGQTGVPMFAQGDSNVGI